MKTIAYVMFFLSIGFAANAQSGCPVKKSYAFYTVTSPGMAMADEDGNTINPSPVVDRFIYIEWTGAGEPMIENVTYDRVRYSANITAVEGRTIVPGDGSENNKAHTITINKCNRLFKISLDASGTGKANKTDAKEILIKLKVNDKTCEIVLKKETQLMTLPRY